MKLPNLEKFKN